MGDADVQNSIWFEYVVPDSTCGVSYFYFWIYIEHTTGCVFRHRLRGSSPRRMDTTWSK